MVRTAIRETSTGAMVKRLRSASFLTPKKLAVLAGVTPAEVRLFERDLPVKLDSRRRILKELWAIKTEK